MDEQYGGSIQYARRIGMRTMMVLACGLASIATASPHKEIDIAAAAPDGVYHAVLLCTRPSPDKPTNIPGHAFVGFSREKSGKRDFVALGHTTHQGLADALLSYKGYLKSSKGAIEAEKFSAVNEQCLLINTDKAHYEAAWKIAAGHNAIIGATFEPGERTAMDYTLGEADCMGMMIEIAKLFAPTLKIPVRSATELPRPYLRRMIDAN